jgi:hypothetical protein
VLMLGCFVVVAFALSRVWKQGGLNRILLWFFALLILHDLIGWPFYTWADRVFQRVSIRPRPRVPWINHVRVPFFLSAVLLLTAFPLILRLSAGPYSANSGTSESPYLDHWLFVTGALFGGSGLLYGLRLWRASRRGAARTGD